MDAPAPSWKRFVGFELRVLSIRPQTTTALQALPQISAQCYVAILLMLHHCVHLMAHCCAVSLFSCILFWRKSHPLPLLLTFCLGSSCVVDWVSTASSHFPAAVGD